MKREDVRRGGLESSLPGTGIKYCGWEVTVPEVVRRDSLWKVEAYRLGLFLADLAWSDVTQLVKDRRTWGVADQLFRAVENISSNVAEGYSRGTGRDRARFYEYALGSARESRDWYYKGRHLLEAAVVEYRLDLCTMIIRLTITMAASERRTNRKVTPFEQSASQT